MRTSPRIFRLLSALLLLAALPACGAATGAAATVGNAAYDERGVGGVAYDTVIAARIREAYFQSGIDLLLDVGLEVYEGRVLITGVVENEQMRADAVRIAWEQKNVNDVLNELIVAPDSDFINEGHDAWITTKLETSLIADFDVYANNFSATTTGGVVYLMGVARSQAELNRVIAHARDISRVRRVVSHVRLRNTGAAP
ncbi:MAG: BON domain-containing protein [Rhodospirillales bacterium]